MRGPDSPCSFPLSVSGSNTGAGLSKTESLIRAIPDLSKQQHHRHYRGNPNCCQTLNHGFEAHIWSCRRFRASRSLTDMGLVSGSALRRSSHSMSAIILSASICVFVVVMRANSDKVHRFACNMND